MIKWEGSGKMVKSAAGTSEESERIGSIQLVEVVHFINYQDIGSDLFFM